MRSESGTHQRALHAGPAYAAAHPQRGLPLDAVPSARRRFPHRRALLLALPAAWPRLYRAPVERLTLAHETRGQDAAQIAVRAWAECRRRHPVLRELLDQHIGELATRSFGDTPASPASPASPPPTPVEPVDRRAVAMRRVACPA